MLQPKAESDRECSRAEVELAHRRLMQTRKAVPPGSTRSIMQRLGIRTAAQRPFLGGTFSSLRSFFMIPRFFKPPFWRVFLFFLQEETRMMTPSKRSSAHYL